MGASQLQHEKTLPAGGLVWDFKAQTRRLNLSPRQTFDPGADQLLVKYKGFPCLLSPWISPWSPWISPWGWPPCLKARVWQPESQEDIPLKFHLTF